MELLTTRQMCELFGVNARTIRRWELLGTLPKAKRMPAKRWVRAEVERAMGQAVAKYPSQRHRNAMSCLA